MGISSVVSALVLGASLTFASFENNIEATVVYEKTVFATINKEQHNSKEVTTLLQMLHDSSETFNTNVIAYLNLNRDTWLQEDSKKFGQDLANIAQHINEKLGFYKALKKSPLKKNKQAKEILLTLEASSKTMQKNIQDNIDYAYMYIDARQSFSMLQSVSDVQLDTFWFSEDEETQERTLFVSASTLESEDLEKLFKLEDQLTEALQKIHAFDFNAVSKQHFSRVSFL